MLHHAVVVLIIAVPLGLFAALVATGCRVLRSDLARVGWIGLALLPILVSGAWEVSLLFWLTASLCAAFWLLRSIGNRARYRPSIQTLMAATFMAALAGLIIGKTGWQSRQELLALLMTSLAFATWTSQAVAIGYSCARIAVRWNLIAGELKQTRSSETATTSPWRWLFARCKNLWLDSQWSPASLRSGCWCGQAV